MRSVRLREWELVEIVGEQLVFVYMELVLDTVRCGVQDLDILTGNNPPVDIGINLETVFLVCIC